MAMNSPDALTASRRLLRLLIGANLLLAFLILVGLVASLAAPEWVFRALGADPGNAEQKAGLRAIAVLGLVAAPLTHVVLSRLLSIVETVRAGDPFVEANARRLRTIAWAVLGLEATHLLVGIAAAAGSSEGAPIDVDWSFSLTRWLVVLLLFVLARVFGHGTRMREDLEGTV